MTREPFAAASAAPKLVEKAVTAVRRDDFERPFRLPRKGRAGTRRHVVQR